MRDERKLKVYGIKVLNKYALLKLARNIYEQFQSIKDINKLIHFVDIYLFNVGFAFGKIVFDF